MVARVTGIHHVRVQITKEDMKRNAGPGAKILVIRSMSSLMDRKVVDPIKSVLIKSVDN